MRYFYLLLFCTTLVNAQKTPTFPRNQHSYLGGVEGFYKDFQKLLLAKNLQPCANKQELFLAEIIIKGDGSALLSDSDQSPGAGRQHGADVQGHAVPRRAGEAALGALYRRRSGRP